MVTLLHHLQLLLLSFNLPLLLLHFPLQVLHLVAQSNIHEITMSNPTVLSEPDALAECWLPGSFQLIVKAFVFAKDPSRTSDLLVGERLLGQLLVQLFLEDLELRMSLGQLFLELGHLVSVLLILSPAKYRLQSE